MGVCMYYMGACQNYGPLLGPLNTSCHIIFRTQKRTTILTTTHIDTWTLRIGQSALDRVEQLPTRDDAADCTSSDVSTGTLS